MIEWMEFKRITIMRVRRPSNQDINDEIQWLSRSLGLFSDRDKEKSCYRVFLVLLKEKRPMSSDEIADNTNLTRATVIHHINKLMESGIVTSTRDRYLLRDDIDHLIDDIETDIMTTLNEVKKTTKHIKESLNI